MRKIRFDVHLSDSDIQALEDMATQCYRSRKNLAESLIMMAIETYKSDQILMSLDKLGLVQKKDGKQD